MDPIFQRLLDNNFAELHGLTVHATIPVTEALSNEIILSILQGNPQIEYCHIHIHPENRITLDVKSPLWPWALHMKLKLFGSIDITHSLTIRAFLENNVLLGKLSSLFNMLPDGIHLYEDQIAIDLGAFINSREQRILLDLIRAAEIKTEEHRLLLDIELRK